MKKKEKHINIEVGKRRRRPVLDTTTSISFNNILWNIQIVPPVFCFPRPFIFSQRILSKSSLLWIENKIIWAIY